MPKLKIKTGRKPLPPQQRLRDGLPQELWDWLAATATRLQVSQQMLIRLAISRFKNHVEQQGDVVIDVVEAQRAETPPI